MRRARTVLRKLAKRLRRRYDVYNRIEVSRSALIHNLGFFQQRTNMSVIPVLKGNAYGHGIEQAATAFRERSVPYVAVDGYFEALRVREHSKQPILVMGMIKPENIPRLRLYNFAFVVQHKAIIKAFGGLNKKVRLHLEINTGMNRYGVPTTELDEYIELLKKYPRLQLEGVMSHLADSDGTDAKTVDDAVSLFDESVEKVLSGGLKPTLFHVGQSAGSLRASSRYANTIRVGIGLYGINPFPATHPLHDECKELRPAMKLISTISRVNDLKKGDKVSYNYTFTAKQDMRVGVLPLGYYEGVNRALSNESVVKAQGRFLPIAGRVCMNHTMVSLEGTDLKQGDEVVVYSDIPTDPNCVDAISQRFGLFNYNLLTNLSPDVRRVLTD